MDKGIIYGIRKSCCEYIKYFYEMEDAIEWCESQIANDVGGLYYSSKFRFCEDHKDVRTCLVGHNGGYGNIIDYEIKAIDVY